MTSFSSSGDSPGDPLNDPWNDACRASLVQSLQRLADGCPDPIAAGSPVHRLRNLILVLKSQESFPDPAPAPGLTLSQALNLVSTSRALLTTLLEQDTTGFVGPEMSQALSETLESLVDELGRELRAQQATRVRGLYVIIDPQVTGGREPIDIARAAINGGARMLQLRDKLRDKGESLPLAKALQQLCQDNDAMLIINDHVDIAAAVGAAGVHVGQTDLPVAEARRVLAPHQVLGRSNREIHLLVESQEMGADHVAFGAIYPTTTKGGGRGPQGIEPLLRARAATTVPLIAIGGINAENVAPVVQAGADAICVTAAVGSAPDPEAAASRLVKAIREAGGRV